MTLLHDAVEAKKMDVRVIERNINRGVLAMDAVKEALKQLPDDSANAEWVTLDSLSGGEQAGPYSNS